MVKLGNSLLIAFFTATVVYGLLKLLEEYYLVGTILGIMPLAAMVLIVAGGKK